MAQEPFISVLVPAYRCHAMIVDCLEALARQTTDGFEVIVVDSSPDELTAEATRRFAGVRLHRVRERLGPQGARNVGAAVARGRALAFTDPDCRPGPSWVSQLRAAHEAGNQLVSGPVECADPGWFNRGVHWCKFGPWIAGGAEKRIPIRPTANLSVTQRSWETIGEFAVEGWSGDAEWCWRAQRAGFEIRFEPRAVVSHRHDARVLEFLRERWSRGRSFASVRATFWAWSRPRIALALATAPAVPALLATRRLNSARDAGRLREFWVTLPVQLLGYLAWTLGEARTWVGRIAGRA